MSAKSCSAASTSVQSTSSSVIWLTQLPSGATPRAGAAVGVVGRALPLVVVRRADQQVEQPLLLVQAQHLADLGGPLQDQVRAVEEDRLLGHRHDEPALGGLRGVDVVLGEAQAGIGHARPHLGHLVADPADAGNPLAVEPRGNRARPASRARTPPACRPPGSATESTWPVMFENAVTSTPSPASSRQAPPCRGSICRTRSGLERRLGQLADAEILGLQFARLQGLLQVLHGLLRTAHVVHPLQFTIFDRSHDGVLQKEGIGD